MCKDESIHGAFEPGKAPTRLEQSGGKSQRQDFWFRKLMATEYPCIESIVRVFTFRDQPRYQILYVWSCGKLLDTVLQAC